LASRISAVSCSSVMFGSWVADPVVWITMESILGATLGNFNRRLPVWAVSASPSACKTNPYNEPFKPMK
jgi:hypothetical protein